MHAACQSTLIFEKKELYFLYILLNILCNFYSRPALFNLDLKEFFKSSSESGIIYSSRLFIQII